MKAWLLDTGPIVAYLDAADSWHDRVVEPLDGFDGQLHTTCAVVTESMYFLQSHSNGPAMLVE